MVDHLDRGPYYDMNGALDSGVAVDLYGILAEYRAVQVAGEKCAVTLWEKWVGRQRPCTSVRHDIRSCVQFTVHVPSSTHTHTHLSCSVFLLSKGILAQTFSLPETKESFGVCRLSLSRTASGSGRHRNRLLSDVIAFPHVMCDRRVASKLLSNLPISVCMRAD